MNEENTPENDIISPEEKLERSADAPPDVENAELSESGEENTPPQEVKGAHPGGERQKRGRRGGDHGEGRKGKGGRGRSRTREKEEKEFAEEVIDIARVTRVVKGGRRLRFRATVVIGDRKGRVGIGTGKSNEVSIGVQKAVSDAKKHLIRVPIHEGTIPHEIKHKFKSARILLMPAKPGTGIIAGGALRKIADLSGIQNILGKSYGTSNTLVNAQAMIQALQLFRKKQEKKENSVEQKVQE